VLGDCGLDEIREGETLRTTSTGAAAVEDDAAW